MIYKLILKSDFSLLKHDKERFYQFIIVQLQFTKFFIIKSRDSYVNKIVLFDQLLTYITQS